MKAVNKAVLLIALSLLAGCDMAPKYQRPKTLADEGGFSFGQKYGQDGNSLGRWWEKFNDPLSNKLVEEVLQNNYDLKIASAKILQAQAEYKMAGGKLAPQLSIEFDRQFSRQSSGPPNSGMENTAVINKTRLYDAQISISYVLDIFGKLKSGRTAKLNELLAAEANKRAVINAMIASVLNARANIAALQNRLNIAEKGSQNFAKAMAIVEDRYKLGLASPLEVRLARENAASAKTAAPEIQLALQQAKNSLAVLLARRPSEAADFNSAMADLPLPQEKPAQIPAELLRRRPDIVEAEFKLKAQNQRIGASIANMYPDLTFSAAMGWKSYTSNPLFVDEAWVYSTVLSLAQPLYRGGQLKAQVDWDKAKFEELAAGYAKTVATAMREVEDQAAAEEILNKKLQFSQLQAVEAQAAEELAIDRYKQGIESVLAVLESQRRNYAAQEALAILKGRLWNARINLFLALGGDWIKEN